MDVAAWELFGGSLKETPRTGSAVVDRVFTAPDGAHAPRAARATCTPSLSMRIGTPRSRAARTRLPF